MKNRLSIFLCALAALFFGSCADLSVDEYEALKADLPSDFNWKDYVEINKDLASSQVVIGVWEKNKAFSGADSAKQAINNCANLLQSEALAREVYLEYVNCPEQGWDRDKRCPGIYAYNVNYNKPVLGDAKDTVGWQCIMGNNINSEKCWLNGWNEFNGFLQDSLSKYLGSTPPTTISFEPIRTMCMFIPKAATANEVLSYLENFKLDSVLIIAHYKSYGGRNDGRPYKYCESGHIGAEKTQSLADKRGSYYDYGRYTFCLNKSDQKIYVIQ